MDTRKYTCKTSVMPRPKTGETKNRNLRVPDEIWQPALENAQADGTTITNVLTRYLQRYNRMTPAARRKAAGLPPVQDEGGEP